MEENKDVFNKNTSSEEIVEELAPIDVTTDEALSPAEIPPEKGKKNIFSDFGGKVKDAVGGKFKDLGDKFKDLGDKVKGLFNKKKQPKTELEQMLAGPELSRGEKARRFFKSQSGWLFVTPALILLAVFTIYPIVNAFIGAFRQNYSGLNGTYNGWGFDNFVRVLKGDTGTGGASFLQCLVNTVVFTVVSVPLSTLLALLISVALTQIKPLQKAYQTVLFLPYLTNSLAMGAVFATFFTIIGTSSNTETVGLVNIVLGWFNIDAVDWMGYNSPTWEIGMLTIPWAKYIVVIIYEVWAGLPFKILILFSALQSVNKQYYDAAKIDGASRSTVLWKITTPMIAPMISYLLVTGIMGGMKQYSSIVGLFGDKMGYDYDMGTMVGYIYQFLEKGATGYAFAGSLLLFAIIMIFTVINNYVSKKRVKV